MSRRAPWWPRRRRLNEPRPQFRADLAIGNLSTSWVYLVGPVVGAVIAVGVAYVLRGPAKAQEARAAVGTPIDRSA